MRCDPRDPPSGPYRATQGACNVSAERRGSPRPLPTQVMRGAASGAAMLAALDGLTAAGRWSAPVAALAGLLATLAWGMRRRRTPRLQAPPRIGRQGACSPMRQAGCSLIVATVLRGAPPPPRDSRSLGPRPGHGTRARGSNAARGVSYTRLGMYPVAVTLEEAGFSCLSEAATLRRY